MRTSYQRALNLRALTSASTYPLTRQNLHILWTHLHRYRAWSLRCQFTYYLRCGQTSHNNNSSFPRYATAGIFSCGVFSQKIGSIHSDEANQPQQINKRVELLRFQVKAGLWQVLILDFTVFLSNNVRNDAWKRRLNVRKERAPALPDFTAFQQLWEALGSRLIESAQEHLFYTQGVRGSVLYRPVLFLWTLEIAALFGHFLLFVVFEAIPYIEPHLERHEYRASS